MTLNARVIAADFDTRLFHLSERAKIVGMEPVDVLRMGYSVGETFTSYKLKRTLFGGSLEVQVKKSMDIESATSTSTSAKQRILGFLHKINFSPSLKVDDLKVPQKIKEPIMIKEINYFEGYPVFTALMDRIKQRKLNWQDLKVGAIHKAKIVKILHFPGESGAPDTSKILVKLSKYVEGFIDNFQLADEPKRKLPKYIRLSAKV